MSGNRVAGARVAGVGSRPAHPAQTEPEPEKQCREREQRYGPGTQKWAGGPKPGLPPAGRDC